MVSVTGKVGRKLLLLCRWLVESLLLKGTLLGCQWGFCWCLLSVVGIALLFTGESVVVVALFAGDHSVVVVALFAGDCLLLLLFMELLWFMELLCSGCLSCQSKSCQGVQPKLPCPCLACELECCCIY